MRKILEEGMLVPIKLLLNKQLKGVISNSKILRIINPLYIKLHPKEWLKILIFLNHKPLKDNFMDWIFHIANIQSL